MSAPAPGQRFRRVAEVVRREIAEETLLVPIRGGLARLQRIFVLNPVGAHVWEHLDGVRDLAAIEASLLEAFEVGPEQARADLLEFVASLLEAGLIEAADGSAGEADPAGEPEPGRT